MNSTVKRQRFISAMLVKLPPAIQQEAQTLLAGLGYRVVAVGHVPAAAERLPVLMPVLVVACSTILKIERDGLEDGAVAVGARVVWLPEDPTAVHALLSHTARQVLESTP